MARVAYTPISDAELERVTRETELSDRVEPRIDTARYEINTGRLILELRGGAVVSIPARLLRGLESATDTQRADVQPMSRGSSLHWPSLDVQYSTIALLSDTLKLKTVSEVARQGGAVSSVRKAASSRENGKKGGRPRKKPLTA